LVKIANLINNFFNKYVLDCLNQNLKYHFYSSILTNTDISNYKNIVDKLKANESDINTTILNINNIKNIVSINKENLMYEK
jgi:hypothetical protein